MYWPTEIFNILENYFEKQSKNNNILSENDKKGFVNEMQIAYNKLTEYKKRDILIPAKPEYLQDEAIKMEILANIQIAYSIEYKWPTEAFASFPKEFTFIPNRFFDRIGSNSGRYMSPFNDNGYPQSLYSRAIPYYIPEDDFTTNPAYHKYVVLNLYESEPDDNFFFGSVAPAFNSTDLDSLGTQIYLDNKTVVGLEGRILREIIRGRKK